MEARINSAPCGVTTKVEKPKPVKVTTRPTKDSPETQTKKKEYRRSLSDSIDTHANFKQVKELWSQKAENGEKLCCFHEVMQCYMMFLPD